jgi:hypothetical protein
MYINKYVIYLTYNTYILYIIRSRIDEDIQKSWRHSDHLNEKLLINPYPNEYNYENKMRPRDDSLDRDAKGHRSTARNRSRYVMQ